MPEAKSELRIRVLLVLMLAVTWIGTSRLSHGQTERAKSALTVKQIYSDKGFSVDQPTAVFVDGIEGRVELDKHDSESLGTDIVRVDDARQQREVMVAGTDLIPEGADKPLSISKFQFSSDQRRVLIFTNTRRVWRYHTRGDYWVFDRSEKSLHKLGGDGPESSLMFAKFSPDGGRVGYVRERNIWLEDLADGSIRQLTFSESDNIVQGTFDWVYEEELGLRDGFRFSPDGRRIAFWRIDTSGVGRFPLVNNTDSTYPKIQWIPYPKVGTTNPAGRIGILQLETDETVWLKFPGDERDHYLARMEWVAETNKLLIQRLNRLQNENRYLMADAVDGSVRTLHIDRDQAWIDVDDQQYWTGPATVLFRSESSGWRHVYELNVRTGAVRQVTDGDFDVIDLVHVDLDRKRVYFLASPDDPTARYLYQVELAGGEPQRLTPDSQVGEHSYSVSAEGTWALHTYSAFDTPPVTELIKLPTHEMVQKLTSSERIEHRLSGVSLGETEFFRVDIGRGVELDAWMIRPPGFDASRKYPLLVYVYGEPAGQTVRNRWGGSTYLWHQMLAQRGLVVMSFDNRGTPAPRGRAWRKSVYRKVGVQAPDDQAAAVRAVLARYHWLDSERVGVWGWSGGGSMTLNAMFKHADLYHTGVSVAPVPNQLYYDTIYQERYMGLPDDNPDGYHQGSAVHFARQLQGNLLLIHGTGDDNCHYQGTETLINELVKSNRPFSLMAYPNRSHAIREGKNTTRHLREMMTSFLMTHLLEH